MKLLWMLKKGVRVASSPHLTWMSHLEWKKNQNSSSGKWLGLSVWRNDKRISPFWEKATFSPIETTLFVDDPYRWSGLFQNDERSWRPRLDFPSLMENWYEFHFPNLMENWYEFHYIFLVHTKFLWYKYLWKLFVKYILIKCNVVFARVQI